MPSAVYILYTRNIIANILWNITANCLHFKESKVVSRAKVGLFTLPIILCKHAYYICASQCCDTKCTSLFIYLFI